MRLQNLHLLWKPKAHEDPNSSLITQKLMGKPFTLSRLKTDLLRRARMLRKPEDITLIKNITRSKP